MKLGIVMEGGAMRGMFTAGVLDVFMEEGIEFDGAIGTSAGATFGCNLKSKQIGRAIRYNCKYCADPRYGSMRSLLKTGDIFDVDFCYHTLPDELDPFDTDTFRDNPMEFYVTATDVKTGKAVYHKCYDGKEKDLEWIRASASLPIFSKIVRIDGKYLLDGGIADSIPLKYFESIGYDKNVVIVTQPANYRKKKNPLIPLAKLKYKYFPAFVEAFSNRHLRYNECIEYINQAEAEDRIFVIRPEQALDVKKAEKDPEKLKKAYEEGRSAAREAIEKRKIKEWMLS